MTVPAPPVVASLFDRILNIVIIGSQEEMSRINAGWVIAAVTNKKAVWNMADIIFVHDPMSVTAFPIHLDSPMPKWFLATPKPLPAAITLLDVTPKSSLGAFGLKYESVLRVSIVRFKKQMGWIDTQLIAAVMTNNMSIRHGSDKVFVCHPMSRRWLVIHKEAGISVSGSRTSPFPAIRTLSHVHPKPFFGARSLKPQLAFHDVAPQIKSPAQVAIRVPR